MSGRVHTVGGVNAPSMQKFLCYLFGQEKIYKVKAEPGRLVAWVSEHIDRAEVRKFLKYWKNNYQLEVELVRMKDRQPNIEY